MPIIGQHQYGCELPKRHKSCKGDYKPIEKKGETNGIHET
jgi:hypothetical protein